MREPMLSVLIETLDHEEALARTLASLISGAVEGMVREVIVCDRGSSDATSRVAEHAGCSLVATGGISAGMRRAKADWLLFLEPGARLCEGWMEPVATHLGHASSPARFSIRNGGLLWRLFRSRGLGHGLLIAKAEALRVTRDGVGAEVLARQVRSARLSAELVPAQQRSV